MGTREDNENHYRGRKGIMFETDWEFGEVRITCDGANCSTEEVIENEMHAPPSYKDVADEIKREGWKITKRGDEWIHLCPGCANPD